MGEGEEQATGGGPLTHRTKHVSTPVKGSRVGNQLRAPAQSKVRVKLVGGHRVDLPWVEGWNRL